MSKKFSQRALIACAVLISLLVSVTGCGKSNPPSTKDAGSAGSSAAPANKGPVTVGFLVQGNAEAQPGNETPIMKEVLKKNDYITFNWIVGPADTNQYRDKINLLVASSDLPDMMQFPSVLDFTKFMGKGLFEPLNDLIDKSAPHLKKFLQDNPAVNKDTKMDDGKIYFFPATGIVKTMNVWQIRQDWLENVGMKQPETIEEWYNVLLAFRDKDPNQNGKKDEIPFTTRNKLRGLMPFAAAWGLGGWEMDDIGDDFFPENNKIIYPPVDPRMKEALTFINKLYKEGLIDKEFATNDLKIWQSRLTTSVSGATMDSFTRLDQNTAALRANIPKAAVVGIAPPKGPKGDQFVTHTQLPVKAAVTINAKSKYKTEIVRFCDYLYGQEGSEYMNFGVVDKHYTKDGSGNIKYTEYVLKNPSGKTPGSVLVNDGRYGFSFGLDIRYENAFVLKESREGRDLYPNFIKPRFPSVSYTSEEKSVLDNKYTEIRTYTEEMLHKFIMGTEPIDKFDDFVKKVKAMGIDDILKANQTAYDRYMKR